MLDMDFNFDGSRPNFEFSHMTPDEVAELLMQIPDSKSTGLNGVSIKFLKMNKNQSSRILTHIINIYKVLIIE